MQAGTAGHILSPSEGMRPEREREGGGGGERERETMTVRKMETLPPTRKAMR